MTVNFVPCVCASLAIWAGACGSTVQPTDVGGVRDAGVVVDVGLPDAPRDAISDLQTDAGPASAVVAVLDAVTGPSTLVDFFRASTGLIVVRADGVDLRRSDGTVTSIPSLTAIMMAAFDGTTLVVADQASVSVYDASLTVQHVFAVQYPCLTGVLVAGPRFVCVTHSASNSLWVFDLTTEAVTSSYPLFLIPTLPIQRVPGRDELVLSTSDPVVFWSYAVGPMGAVAPTGNSASETLGSTLFAFDGNPATHVIDGAGEMLQLDAPGCAPPGGTHLRFDRCLPVDGQLGTLEPHEGFLGMADDGAGTLFGVVATEGSPGFGCASGCSAERIDIARRTIVRRSRYVATFGAVVGARYDPYAHTMLFGYNRPAAGLPSTPGGFQIDSIEP